MELEKAIEELKRTIEENNKLLLPHNEQFFNKKEKQEIRMQNTAIKTVLQALDNSIPKEKVLEQMQKLNDLANDPKKEYYYANYRYTMNVLEDLLGERRFKYCNRNI